MRIFNMFIVSIYLIKKRYKSATCFINFINTEHVDKSIKVQNAKYRSASRSLQRALCFDVTFPLTPAFSDVYVNIAF